MMQEKRLLETLDTCRNLYNHFLFESRLSYKEGYKINHYEMSAIIPTLTKGKEIYSKVTQPVIDQFYRQARRVLSVVRLLRRLWQFVYIDVLTVVWSLIEITMQLSIYCRKA